MSYSGYPNSGSGASYGARNYGHRSSGRSHHHKSHNASDTSHSSGGTRNSANAAAAGPDLSLHNGVRPGGMQRSSGRRSSGRRSSGRRHPHHHHSHQHRPGTSFETASTISSSASILPATTVSSNGTSTSFSSHNSGPPPPRSPPKSGLFNMTGRGLGATIAVIAGIVLGATGLMMLVMGFSGGTAMLVMGPGLMVAGIVAIGIGAGLCICCRKKENKDDTEAQPENKDASFDDLESSQGSVRPPPAGHMLGGGGGANVNMAYSVDGAEDSLDAVPTVSQQVPQQQILAPPPPQQQQYNAYGQPYTMTHQPRTLITSSSSAPAPTPAAGHVPAVLGVSAPQQHVPLQSSVPVQVVSSVPSSLSSSMDSSTGVVVSNPVPVRSIPAAQKAPTLTSAAPVAPVSTAAPVEPKPKPQPVKVVKPRAKLSPLNPVESVEPVNPRPTVKLPVPVRGPVVNFNPMPPPKQKGHKRSSSPGSAPVVPASPDTPQSSYSENSEFSSSADESGQRINSSVETDSSAAGNNDGTSRKHRIKKRVSFSDDDKKKKKAKRKLRNSQEKNEAALRNSLDGGERPKSILASKSGAEDFKYISPPNALKENTRLNRGRSQSPQRSSQRQSRRARSQSPRHNPHPRPPSDPNALHNGPRQHAPQAAPQAAPAPRPRPPLDQNDPAVQSRLQRNSRRRSKERQPRRQQQQGQQGMENQGYVNEAMDLSPTQLSPDHNSKPVASSSPNTSYVMNNNTMKSEAVSNWAPIQASTPPGTPKLAVLQLAHQSNSSTETEI